MCELADEAIISGADLYTRRRFYVGEVVLMVSMAGYPVSAYFFMMAATYVLIAITMVVRLIVEQKDVRMLWNGYAWERHGPTKKLWLLGFAGAIVVVLVYMAPVRVGTVMLCNGVVSGILISEASKLFKGGSVW